MRMASYPRIRRTDLLVGAAARYIVGDALSNRISEPAYAISADIAEIRPRYEVFGDEIAVYGPCSLTA